MDPIPQTLNLPELLLGSGSLHGYSLRYLPRGFIGQGVFFFVVAPFCSCPASLVSRIFFAVGPGCAKCYFLLRSVGRRDLSAGPEQKKTPPRVFFFAPAPGKGRRRRSPVPARVQSKKKHHPGCVFFFWLRPWGKAGQGEAPLGAGTGPEQKKNTWAFAWAAAKKTKHTVGGVFFFALAPCRRPTGLLLPLPFARAGGVFFLLWPRAGTGLLLLLPFPGAGAKRTPWVVFFFFALAPCGRSLTHCGPGWRCLPLAGVVCFFFCCGPARTGVVFFFFLLWPRPDAHSGAISARPGWCFFFFLLRPRRVFLDNNKKCLGYYIESKKTRRGHSKKKKKKHFQGSYTLLKRS